MFDEVVYFKKKYPALEEVRFSSNPSPVSADKHTSPMELTNR